MLSQRDSDALRNDQHLIAIASASSGFPFDADQHDAYALAR
jgi:hypothetical protein